MIELLKYSDEYYTDWNNFIINSCNGTIFHRLDFLDYHGDKFIENKHNLIWLKSGIIFGVMPMALFNNKGKLHAKSPFGASYGGIVTKDPLNYSDSKQVVELLIKYLKTIGVERITITLPLKVFEKSPSDTLVFAFLSSGFRFVNSDISSVVSLIAGSQFENKLGSLSRKYRKAAGYNVEARLNQSVESFWEVCRQNFRKHGVDPTHSLAEWRYLCDTFPENFWNDVAYIGSIPVAGIGHVRINEFADSSFYLCSDPAFSNTQALSSLILESLRDAREKGIIWFDFGTSSVSMQARDNIFRFKESFGATGYFRHTIESFL